MLNRIDENLLISSPHYVKQKEYWTKKLSGDIEETRLFRQEDGNTEAGEPRGVDIPIPEAVIRQLMKISKNSDISMFIIMVSVLKLLIYRYGGDNEVTVMSPVYVPAETDDTINRWVMMRSKINVTGTVKELFMEVRQTVLDAYKNQDYPSRKLIEMLETGGQIPGPTVTDTIIRMGNIHEPLEPPVTGVAEHPAIFTFSRDEQGVTGSINYTPGHVEDGHARQVARHFGQQLENALNGLDEIIAGVSCLTEEEKERQLFKYNETEAEYPHDKPIHRLFEEQVEKTPDILAVMNGNGALTQTLTKTLTQSLQTLTYSQLNKKANRLANTLRTRGVKEGEITAIQDKRDADIIVAVLAVLKAGGTYMPVDTSNPPRRVRYMLENANTSLLLLKEHENARSSVPGKVEILDLNDEKLYTGDDTDKENHVKPEDPAYIIYTSGSTGRPKGVIIRHRGLTNYIKWAEKVYLRGRKIDFPYYSPLAFDLTVTSIYLPLITGNRLWIYKENKENSENGAGEQHVVETIVAEGKVQGIKLTPAHLKILREQEFSKNTIKVMILGGEELPAALAHEIQEKFGREVEIYNEYGPTETVVGCMIHRYHPDDGKRNGVPIGKPADNVQLYILDSQLQPVPAGVTGELYISGDGVAIGYLSDPEHTHRRFCENPFLPGTRMYRSGDRARRLPNGNIEYRGRIDGQVKVRGYRIEIGEIESRLVDHEEIAEAVVTIRNDESGEQYLCAYTVATAATGRKNIDTVRIKEYLGQTLPEYMIPAFFISLDKLPLTPNGKIDKNRLPAPVIGETDRDYVPATGELEEKLVKLWAEVLGIDENKIGVNTNFFQLGGQSLKATILVSKVYKTFEIRIGLAEMFENPTVQGMAALLTGRRKDSYEPLPRVSKKDYYPLSSAQKRLYLLYQRDPQGLEYNIPNLARIEGNVDKDRFDEAFNKLVQRHESLRTTFEIVEGVPVQRIHDDVDENTAVGYSESSEEPKSLMERFVKPFQLQQAPLVRLELINHQTDGLLLMADMHHIISDAVSFEIMVKDFKAYLEGKELPPLEIHYKEYSEWQNRERHKQNLKKQESYWLKEFEGEIPEIHMPVDFKRPSIRTIEGTTLGFQLPPGYYEKLKQRAQEENATLNMICLTIYYIMLWKVTGQEDIIVGSATTGRKRIEFQSVIGMFVNVLALRNFPEKKKTIRTFLGEIRNRTLQAFENQDYQYEDLAEKVVKKRDYSRYPLFDVGFEMQNIEMEPQPETGGGPEKIRFIPYNYGTSVSKIDLTLRAVDNGKNLSFSFEYSTKIFKESTIKRLIDYYKEIALKIIENMDVPLENISLAHHLLSAKVSNMDEYRGDFDF